jgi:two-component system, NtrC family, response regulator AtoC
VLERLRRWPFPGNVRELENWIARAVVLADGPRLTRADFPEQLFEEPARKAVAFESEPGLEAQVEVLETRLIREALLRQGGNKSAAARELQMTERAMRYKVKKYGL